MCMIDGNCLILDKSNVHYLYSATRCIDVLRTRLFTEDAALNSLQQYDRRDATGANVAGCARAPATYLGNNYAIDAPRANLPTACETITVK